MGELLQYRFPGEEGPESLGGHAVGNLLIAAMTAVEDGDFEEAVRQMNRVLAVRGQVVPASSTPLVLHAELRRRAGGRRPVPDRGHERDRPGLADARGGRRLRRCRRRDRGGGPHRHRSGQPVHERPAEPPPARDPGRAPGLARAADLRLQRGDPAGRDDRASTWPTTSRRSSGTPRAGSSTSSSPTTARSARPATAGRRTADGEAIRLRWPPEVERPPKLVLDDLVDPDDPAPPRPGPPGGGDHPHRRARRGDPPPGRRGRPDRVTRRAGAAAADDDRGRRDLVARSGPSSPRSCPQRACDRAAESAGLGSALATREAAVARLAVRLGGEPTEARRPARAPPPDEARPGRRARPAGDAVRLGRPPRTTAGSPGCAGGSWPAARSASPPGGPISSSSSRRTRRRSSRPVSPTSGCRRRGGCAAAVAS